jgi:hypothetical protein
MSKKHRPARRAGETVSLPIASREVVVRLDSVDVEARTAEIVWTTGAVVRRYDWWNDRRYDEELVVESGAVRLERLNSGAPFLNTHNSWRLEHVIGVVVDGTARIEKGQGLATIRFSARDEVEPIWRDIQAGIIRNVSVGYRYHRVEKIQRENDVDLWRVVDWEPLEISAVPIGADPGAGFRESEAHEQRVAQRSQEPLYPCVVVRGDAPVPPAAAPAASSRKEGDMKTKLAGAAGIQALLRAAGLDEEEDDAVLVQRLVRAGLQEPEARKAVEKARAARDGDEDEDESDNASRSTDADDDDEDDGEQRADVEAAATARERARISGIGDLVRKFGLDAEFGAKLVKDGVSLTKARKLILDKLADQDDRGARSGEPDVRIARGAQDGDVTYRDAVIAAILHRHDPRSELPDPARQFRGMSLLEIARENLERRGIRTRGMSRFELATEALAHDATRAGPGYHSTSDFPAILANVANKTLRMAYESTPRTFLRWARPTTIVDFKPVQRTQLGGAPDLVKVPENGEFKYGTMGEAKETYALATYGRIIAISRQAIINDDLNAFTRIPTAFGASAADLESDLVYAVLITNGAMNDGFDLFSTEHGNLLSAAVIDEAGLTKGYEAFGNQTGIEGRQIAILPRYLLVPHGDRFVEARKIVTATTPESTDNVNVYAGALEVVQEVRLKGGSGEEDPWFLIADSSRIDTVEYAYLEGQQGVYTETRIGFTTDGIEIKARHDVAAAAIDHRGMTKNPGASPS